MYSTGILPILNPSWSSATTDRSTCDASGNHLWSDPGTAQATEKSFIPEAECTMDTQMDDMMKAFEAWTFQMSKVY